MATKTVSKSIFQIISANGQRSPAICCDPFEFRDSLRKVYDDESLKAIYVLVIATIDSDDTGLVDRRGISRFPVVTGYTFCTVDLNFDAPVLDDQVPPEQSPLVCV